MKFHRLEWNKLRFNVSRFRGELQSSTKIIREEHLLPERQSARLVAAHRCASLRASAPTMDQRQE